MTHEEHCEVSKGHHYVASEFHGRLAKLHRAIAKQHAAGEPELAKLHRQVADTHADFEAHHGQRAAAFGDEVTAKAAAGSLHELYRTLGGQ